MKFSKILRLTFSLMFLITVIFCILFLTLLSGKIRDFREEAQHAKENIEVIQRARLAYDRTAGMVYAFFLEPHNVDSTRLLNALADLDSAVSVALIPEETHTVNPSSFIFRIKTAFGVLMLNPDDEYLCQEARMMANEQLRQLGLILTSRIGYELSAKGAWSNYTQYLIEELLPYVVLYLFIMSAFLILATLGNRSVLNRQLARVSAGVKCISRGDLNFRFPIARIEEEMDYVMLNFNHMATRLQKQNRQLEDKNQQLQSLTESLIESNQHKDRFLANMSHELRTPLNAVIGFAELLHERADRNDIERTKRYSKQIMDAADHLLSLISDLLELARMDAGVKSPDFTTFNLLNCIESTTTMIKPLLHKKNLSLTWHPPEIDDPSVFDLCSDRRFICQILINILNNGVKFTHQGGLTVKLTWNTTSFYIAITDTGIGIAKSDIPLVFKDFQRLDSSLSANYEGLGLGLTLSRRLAHLIGGEISLKSELGVGSTFTLTLPRYLPDTLLHKDES